MGLPVAAPPLGAPIVDDKGFVSQAWAQWLGRAVYIQIGAGNANLPADDIVTLEGLDESKPDVPHEFMPFHDEIEIQRGADSTAMILAQIEDLREQLNSLVNPLPATKQVIVASLGFTPGPVYTLPTATASVLGGVKPDGTSILNSSGAISVTPASVGALASGAQAADSAKLGGTAAASFALTVNVPVVTTTTPLMNGTAAIGTSGKWADGAHVHPVDTSRLASAAQAADSAKLGGSVASNFPQESDNTWTPTQNLTGSGISINFAKYKQIGNVIFYALRVQGTGMGSTAGTNYVTGPSASANPCNCIVSITQGASVGVGSAMTDGKLWLPTFSGLTDITISGFIFTT